MVDGAKIILLIRQIIEGILLVWGIYILSGRKLDNKVIYAGAAYGMLVKIIRLLPISFGVHSILSLTGLIFVVSQMTNIDIMKTISNGIILFLMLSVADWVALGVYTNLFKLSTDKLLDGSVASSLYGMGPLVIMVITLLLIKLIKERRKNGFNK